jgi:hypothetical protein
MTAEAAVRNGKHVGFSKAITSLFLCRKCFRLLTVSFLEQFLRGNENIDDVLRIVLDVTAIHFITIRRTISLRL